jgi:hypothetical protein
MIKYVWNTKDIVRRIPEIAMRLHYLVSPAVGNLGLLVLLLYRFDDGLSSAWLPLAAAPYYVLYGRDLWLAGYRWGDLVRVCALNLLLIPVNLAGVFRSLQQAATGRKAAFGRTPKVQSRTRTPPLHVFFQWAFLLYLVESFLVDSVQGHYSHSAFALANGIMCFYGISRFLGWQESYADLRRSLSLLTRRALGASARPAMPTALTSERAYVYDAVKLIAPIGGNQTRSEGVSSVDRVPELV